MLKFVGYEAQSGYITDERTGEARPWSNRIIRCVTDERLPARSYGMDLVKNKIRSVDICRAFNIPFSAAEVASDSFENRVNDYLNKLFNKDVAFDVGITKGTAEVIGFHVVSK